MSNSVSFHAPELLSSAILNSNLRALFLLDSWAVGVLLAMICGSLDASPFEREADWTQGTLTVEQATRKEIQEVQEDYGGFLMRLDISSGGFLFRHGWIVKLLLGLMAQEPTQRLTVHSAYEIALEESERMEAMEAITKGLTMELADAALAEPTPLPSSDVDAAECEAQAPAVVASPTLSPESEPSSRPPAPSSPVAEADDSAALELTDAMRLRPSSSLSPSQPLPLRSSKPEAERRTASKGVDAGRRDTSRRGESNELDRFRKLAKRDASGEPFRSLEAMLNIGARGGAWCVIQRRPWPGIKNYGEVIGFRNRADGDRWDIFVPGLADELPENEPLPLRRVIGVVLIKGGNHKLAVELDIPSTPTSKERVATDIRAFQRVYVKTHTVSAARVKYLALDELDF